MLEAKIAIEDYPLVARVDVCGREYSYALFDKNAEVGNMVLVSGRCSNMLLEIVEIVDVEDVAEKDLDYITECVIGIVNTSAYDKRVEEAERISELRRQMDARKRDIERRKNDDYYAEIDPEYKKMLEEFRKLTD